jgi:hypothetical protein
LPVSAHDQGFGMKVQCVGHIGEHRLPLLRVISCRAGAMQSDVRQLWENL